MSTKTRSRQAFTKARAHKLKLNLLNTFLLWRDHLSCTKKARACFDKMADTVDEISREALRLYVEAKDASVLPAAVQTTLADINKSAFNPDCAEHFLCRVLVLGCKMDSIAEMEAIERGDQEVLVEFKRCLARNRTLALETLEDAELVIRRPQADGRVHLEWPKPDHPAAAAYLATVGAPLRVAFSRSERQRL